MKRSSLTPLALILGWLISLGFVFVLGLFAAFTFHRAPEDKDLSAFTGEEREGIVLAENLLGESLEWDRFVSGDPREQLPEQFVALIGALNGVSDPIERTFMGRRIAQLLPISKVPRAIQWMLEEPKSRASDEMIVYLLKRWAEGDGRNAMQYVLTVLPTRFGEAAITAVLSGWATKDGRAAWAWVMGDQIDSKVKVERLTAVLWAMHGEGDGGTEMLGQIGDVEIQSAVAARYAGKIREREGNEASIDWLTRGLEEWDEALIGQFVGDWSWEEPREASEWVDTLPAPAHEWGMSRLAPIWAASEGEAALEWVLGNELSEGRETILAKATQTWIEAEGLNVVADFLNRQNPTAGLDPIIEQLAYETMAVDAETALSWAQAIGDESKRRYAVSVVSKNWVRSDKAAELEYIETEAEAPGTGGLIEGTETAPSGEVGGQLAPTEAKEGEAVEVIETEEPDYMEISD